jgi:cytochrome c oxidase subunit II
MFHMARRSALLAGLLLPAGAALFKVVAQPAIPEIRITARKFQYTPNQITLKKDQPVVLVLTSEDRIHGFKIEDYGLRADIVPGQETHVPFTPAKAGTVGFHCDVFCGDSHEDMEGTITVEA